jgi:hypothetical protein
MSWIAGQLLPVLVSWSVSRRAGLSGLLNILNLLLPWVRFLMIVEFAINLHVLYVFVTFERALASS